MKLSKCVFEKVNFLSLRIYMLQVISNVMLPIQFNCNTSNMQTKWEYSGLDDNHDQSILVLPSPFGILIEHNYNIIIFQSS